MAQRIRVLTAQASGSEFKSSECTFSGARWARQSGHVTTEIPLSLNAYQLPIVEKKMVEPHKPLPSPWSISDIPVLCGPSASNCSCHEFTVAMAFGGSLPYLSHSAIFCNSSSVTFLVWNYF